MIYEPFSSKEFRALNESPFAGGNSLFRPLSSPDPDPDEIDAAPAEAEERADARGAALQDALDRLVEMHRLLAAERQHVSRHYEQETIRWLSALIAGIAPQLSRAMLISTIEDAVARIFVRNSPGLIRIRAHPGIVDDLRTASFARDGAANLDIEEDPSQSALSVEASWEAGRFTFDATAAIESLSQMLEEQLAQAVKSEDRNELKKSE